MDNLSSSDLDAPSKTPLFIAIAAVIVGIAGLALGWLGFTRASELEQQLVDMENASSGIAEVEAMVDETGQRIDKLASDMTVFSQEVNRILGAVEDDMSGIKKNVRAVAIEAGTAKKMVEELERRGVQAASAPSPAPRAVASSSDPGSDTASDEEATASGDTDTADTGKGGSYTIKSGDTLGKIAAAYNISLGELLTANPGIDPRRLRIGQQISIPPNN